MNKESALYGFIANFLKNFLAEDDNSKIYKLDGTYARLFDILILFPLHRLGEFLRMLTGKDIKDSIEILWSLSLTMESFFIIVLALMGLLTPFHFILMCLIFLLVFTSLRINEMGSCNEENLMLIKERGFTLILLLTIVGSMVFNLIIKNLNFFHLIPFSIIIMSNYYYRRVKLPKLKTPA